MRKAVVGLIGLGFIALAIWFATSGLRSSSRHEATLLDLLPEDYSQKMYASQQGFSASFGTPNPTGKIPSILPLLANADLESGKAFFTRKCLHCHIASPDGGHRVGPNLWNVIGRDKGALDGFAYSKAMQEAPGIWDYEEINAFIFKPVKHVPGTRMALPGVFEPQNRANVIAYLRTLHDNPPEIPATSP